MDRNTGTGASAGNAVVIYSTLVVATSGVVGLSRQQISEAA